MNAVRLGVILAPLPNIGAPDLTISYYSHLDFIISSSHLMLSCISETMKPAILSSSIDVAVLGV
jgi:hypothetical protein